MSLVLGLLTDLFFSARIRETAARLRVACEIVRDPELFLARAREAAPAVAIVDMNLRGGDPADAVRRLRADEVTRAVPVVAFYAHVQEDQLASALAAGCDRVVTRGQLTKMLPALLAGKLPPAEPCG